MGINIVANFVSPAYGISTLYPEKIDFRLGGLITLILSVMVCPWVLVSSPQAITIFVSILWRDHQRRRLGPVDRGCPRRLVLYGADAWPGNVGAVRGRCLSDARQAYRF